MGHHNGSAPWDTDTVIVHRPLMDMDIVMDHRWVTDIVMLHHMVMDTVIALDHLPDTDIATDLQADMGTTTDLQVDTDTVMLLQADTDIAMDHQADTDTAMLLLVHMVTDTVTRLRMDTDIVTFTVPVHPPPIVTTPLTDIPTVISTKNLKFFKWQMSNQLLFNQSPIRLHSSKIIFNYVKRKLVSLHHGSNIKMFIFKDIRLIVKLDQNSFFLFKIH